MMSQPDAAIAVQETTPQTEAPSTRLREAFFLKYAHEVRAKFPDVPLIVTGGFRSRQGMQAAITEGGCDLVGVGRPSAVDTAFAKNVILNPSVSDSEAQLHLERVKVPWVVSKLPVQSLTAGVITVCSTLLISRLE